MAKFVTSSFFNNKNTENSLKFTQNSHNVLFLFQLNAWHNFDKLKESRHACSWVEQLSKSLFAGEEDPGDWLCLDPCWLCSEVITNNLFFYWIFVVRWPAHTWGQINAPPPNRRQSLNRLLKKFREKGTVQDLRKRRPSAREGVEEVTNKAKVEEVSALLDAAHPEQTLRRTGIHQVIIGLGLNKVLITC